MGKCPGMPGVAPPPLPLWHPLWCTFGNWFFLSQRSWWHSWLLALWKMRMAKPLSTLPLLPLFLTGKEGNCTQSCIKAPILANRGVSGFKSPFLKNDFLVQLHQPWGRGRIGHWKRKNDFELPIYPVLPSACPLASARDVILLWNCLWLSSFPIIAMYCQYIPNVAGFPSISIDCNQRIIQGFAHPGKFQMKKTAGVCSRMLNLVRLVQNSESKSSKPVVPNLYMKVGNTVNLCRWVFFFQQ